MKHVLLIDGAVRLFAIQEKQIKELKAKYGQRHLGEFL